MSHGPAWTRALAASRLKASGGSRGRDGDSMVQYGKPNEMNWNTGAAYRSIYCHSALDPLPWAKLLSGWSVVIVVVVAADNLIDN